MIEAFPEEMRHDILLRLPIKCLIRCTSVSKPWLSIIKNTGFIRAHLRHRHEPLILVHCSNEPSRCEETKEVYSLYRDNSALDEYCEIDLQIDPMNKRFRVAGICDGLVCLADDILSKAEQYVIWNPSIRKAVMLPEPGFTFITHGPFEDSVGFGFDATTNDYKVVRLVTLQTLEMSENKDVKSPTVAEVYSIATGSWRSLGSVTPPCDISGTRPQTFFNGTIHWIVSHWKDVGGVLDFILAFDIVNESFREILLPTGVKLGFDSSQVSVTGDGKHLAFFTTYNDVHRINYLDIWVMEEYCQHESWTKMITLAPLRPEGSALPMAFCFRQSGEVLLELREPYLYREPYFYRTPTLVSLDPATQRMNNVGILDRVFYSVDSYEESLVLLNVDNAISC